MSLLGIWRYVSRAMGLALPLTLIIYGIRWLHMRRKKLPEKQPWLVILFLLHFTALIAITAVRDGAHLMDFWKIPHTTDSVQMIPILLTLQQGRGGAWYLVYPIVGNIIWFVPFGYLLRRLRPHYGWGRVLGYSMLLSVGIECLQWVLLSGISDIDDVIFNAVGGWLGWYLGRYPQNEAQGC